MNPSNAFEIAQAVLLSLGGGGIIVFALSNWLGKVWANRLMATATAQHEKDLEKLNSESGNRFIDYKTINFFNNLIQVFVDEISRKTGQAAKPTKTGFNEYASNRIKTWRHDSLRTRALRGCRF